MNFKGAWSALWSAPTPAAEPDAFTLAADEARGKGVSEAALWEAGRFGGPVTLPEATFRAYKPMPGVVPDGIAMDSVLPPTNDFAQWAMQGMLHEGLAFLGYPYLAQLTQRAEYRMISEKRAEHATRKWIKLTGPDEKKLDTIDAEMKRLGVKEKFKWSLEYDGFMGRAQIFMDFGDFDKPKELDKMLPIDPGKISPARPLRALRTVEPMWSYPGPYGSSNPLSPDFYKPSSWYVYGRTIHDSRMLTFVGNEVPDMLKPAYAFGGLSLSQMTKPYVDNWIRTRQSVSDMVSAFSVMVLKTDMQSVLQGGPATDVVNRAMLANQMRNNRGLWVIDKAGEEFENVAVPLSGLGELQDQSQVQMCSASSIPQIILLGTKEGSLGGSNSDEIRFFYDDIKSNEQEHTCRPNLEVLLQVIQLSLFGEIDEAIGFEFNDLWEMDEDAKAKIRKADADSAKIYIDGGVVSPDEERDRLSNEEGGMYHGLTGPAPELPDENPDDADPDTETSA